MAATSTVTTAVSATFLVVILLALPFYSTAQSPMQAPEPSSAEAPGPASLDCSSVLLNMSDCLTFVEAGSNLTKPDTACCPELAGLVESNPVCLCQLLGDPGKTGFSIDVSKALKLPSACGLSTPPVSVCAAVGVPVSVPTASEPAAQSPMQAPEPSSAEAPGPASLDCSSVLLNMSDCLTFVEAGSNLTKPDTACCPELAGLVESNPVCLCQLLGDPGKTGFSIDVSKALKLPSACGLSTPPVSACAAVGVPVSVPTASAPAGSPKALASSPVGGNDGSGGRIIEASLTCFFASLATLISITFF